MATPEELARLVQYDHAAEITGLEQGLIAAILGDIDARFTALAARTVAAWTAAFGAPDAFAVPGPALRRLLATVRSAVRRIVGNVGERAASALADALPSFTTVASRQSAQFMRAASGTAARRLPTRLPRALVERASAVAAAVEERLGRALAALRTAVVARWADVATAVGIARLVTSTVQQHVVTTVGETINHVMAGAVRRLADRQLWIAEADACVNCAAYSGLTVAADQPFPGGLSWDPNQRTTSAPAVDRPPLHPHCRCRVLPWMPLWETGEVPLPLYLQRQARSNIAHGTAGTNESRAARIRAAAELLRSSAVLPPDVRAAAQRAVRNRRFAAA